MPGLFTHPLAVAYLKASTCHLCRRFMGEGHRLVTLHGDLPVCAECGEEQDAAAVKLLKAINGLTEKKAKRV